MKRYLWIPILGIALVGVAVALLQGNLDTYTWLLFFVLTLAGGVIAFMGDRLGRYMGKRRLTIFGLRPRHTALLFTVVGGMLIALTSLGTLTLVNVHVRQAVFDVGNLLRERRALMQDRVRLRQQNRDLLRETAMLRTDHDRWKKRAKTAAVEERRSRLRLDRTLARLHRAKQEAQLRVATLEREVQERSRLAAEKTAAIASLSRLMTARQTALAAAQDNLRQLQARYRTTDSRYREAQSRLAEAQRSLTQTRQEFQVAVSQHKQLQADMDELLDALHDSREQIQTLEKARAALENSRQQLENSRKTLQNEIASLREEKAARDQEARAFYASYELHRGKSVLISLGEDLGWDVIDGREPQTSIRKHVLALVERARTVALERGAGPKENPELALVPARWYKRQADRDLEPLLGVKAIDLVTEEISRANTGAVVRIIAATNTVTGEPVIGEVQVYANRLIFHSGERLAAKEFNGRNSLGQVMESLVSLLQGEVRAEAVSRGMIPRSGAGDNPESVQFGEVSLRDLATTAEQIRKHREGSKVEIVAAADLWTADAMKVSFRVTPLPGNNAGSSSIPGLTAH